MAIDDIPNPVKLPIMGPPTLFTNTVPFTERDGTNYNRTLAELIDFLNRIIDALNASNESMYAAILVELQKTRDDVQAALDEQDARNEARDAVLREDVERAIDQILNSSIELSDEVMFAILTNATSEFRKQLDRILGDLQTEIETGLTEYIDLADKVLRDAITALQNVVAEIPRGKVTIEHKRTAGHNRDVYTVKGNRASIRKMMPKAVSADGSILYNDQITPKQMAAESGIYTLTNCDAATGGARPINNGLNIVEGVAYQDFGKGFGGLVGADLEALLLMKDGSIRAARRSDNKTAAQYVSEGAWSSFGYGPILVENGVANDWYTGSKFSGFVGEASARLIFGATLTGEYKVILVEGKTGQYGISGKQINDVAIAEGLHWAVNLDGGGTVQGMYDKSIIHPSTDSSGERRGFTFIGFTVPTEGEFDTGWIELPPVAGVVSPGADAIPVSVRQVQSEMLLQLAAQVSPTRPPGTWNILSDTPIPVRFRPPNSFPLRGTLAGGSGRIVPISVDNEWRVNAVAPALLEVDLQGVYGTVSARLDR